MYNFILFIVSILVIHISYLWREYVDQINLFNAIEEVMVAFASAMIIDDFHEAEALLADLEDDYDIKIPNVCRIVLKSMRDACCERIIGR